jgi:hypothetical protein
VEAGPGDVRVRLTACGLVGLSVTPSVHNRRRGPRSGRSDCWCHRNLLGRRLFPAGGSLRRAGHRPGTAGRGGVRAVCRGDEGGSVPARSDRLVALRGPSASTANAATRVVVRFEPPWLEAPGALR